MHSLFSIIIHCVALFCLGQVVGLAPEIWNKFSILVAEYKNELTENGKFSDLIEELFREFLRYLNEVPGKLNIFLVSQCYGDCFMESNFYFKKISEFHHLFSAPINRSR